MTWIFIPRRRAVTGGGGTGHRYWRVMELSTSTTQLELSEIQFLQSGSPVSGTIISDHTPVGALTNLNDGNLSNSCFFSSMPAGFYIKWDFGGTQVVTEVRIGQYNEPTEYVAGFELQHSSDNISWVRQALVSGLTPPGNFTLSGAIDVSGGGSTGYQYWRLVNVDVNGSTVLDISEWHLRNGVTVLNTTPTASNAPTGANLPELVDSITTVRIQFGGGVAEAKLFYIGIDAGSPVNVTQIKMGGFDNSGRYPTQLKLEYSDNGYDWTRYGAASGLSYPGNNTLSGAISFS